MTTQLPPNNGDAWITILEQSQDRLRVVRDRHEPPARRRAGRTWPTRTYPQLRTKRS